jgi:cytochrome c oxidase subunit 2
VALAAALACAPLGGAAAQEEPRVGVAHPWQFWHQTPATDIMEKMVSFHELLVFLMVAITLLVLGLLVYVVLRFNARANPTPSRTTHNTLLEVAWTVLPVLVLVVIAIPSFRLLYEMETTEDADVTLKVIGRQWYWDYEYPDHGVSITSIMVPTDEISEGQRRALEVDNPVVLPAGARVRLLITGGDVIHNWGIPSLGVVRDAIPGRVNEVVVTVKHPGTYYGQCRELCGTGHAYMPAVVRAIPREEFDAWIQKQASLQAEGRTQFAARPDGARPADARPADARPDDARPDDAGTQNGRTGAEESTR